MGLERHPVGDHRAGDEPAADAGENNSDEEEDVEHLTQIFTLVILLNTFQPAKHMPAPKQRAMIPIVV